MSLKNMKNRSKIRKNGCFENLKKTPRGTIPRNTVSKNQLPILKNQGARPRTTCTVTYRQTNRQTNKHNAELQETAQK